MSRPQATAIRVLRWLRPQACEDLLPKLRDGFIAPDAATARSPGAVRLPPRLLSQSPTGETFFGPTVTGGRARATKAR